jgi:hypothetical protein
MEIARVFYENSKKLFSNQQENTSAGVSLTRNGSETFYFYSLSRQNIIPYL